MSTTTVTELRPPMGGPELTASVAGQLEAAAELLRGTPGLRVSPFGGTFINYFADSTAKVDEMAALLGRRARWDGNHYSVEQRFGNGVSYRALHICRGVCNPADTCSQLDGEVPAA